MNNKDSLDNIRRKAPAPRKPTQLGEEVMPGTQQMDLFNTQLVAMQQQLQQLSDRYNELSVHHSMLLTELIGVQKSVVNHEHVMQNVMSYLHSADSFIRDQRRSSRVGDGFAGGNEASSNGPALNTSQQVPPIDDTPPSPLQNAEKLLNDSSADTLLNNKNLEHMNEIYRQANGLNSTSPTDSVISRNGGQPLAPGVQTGTAMSGTTMGFARPNGDVQDAVYPVGHNNGIDPMYSEHIHNIPYPMPVPVPGEMDSPDPRSQYGEGRKKSTVVDPGWIRPPQILLVEDDQTCRRIGGKFLYSFKCAIDSAVSGQVVPLRPPS